MSTAQISSPTAQNTPSTPTSQGSLEKAVKFEPPCMSQDEFKAKLALAGQCAIAQATFILGIAAPGRDESLSDSNYAACEQAALVEVSWLGNNGSKPCKDAMIKAFKSASRLILNEATGLMKVTLRQMSAEAHDAVMAMLNTAFSVNVEVFSLRVPHFVFVIPKSEHNIVLFSQSVKALAESATLHVWSWIDLKASGRYTGRQYGQRFRDNCVIGIAGPDAPKVVDAVASMTHAAANSIGAFSRSINGDEIFFAARDDEGGEVRVRGEVYNFVALARFAVGGCSLECVEDDYSVMMRCINSLTLQVAQQGSFHASRVPVVVIKDDASGCSEEEITEGGGLGAGARVGGDG